MSIGNSPESLSQIVVGVLLVGRLGVAMYEAAEVDTYTKTKASTRAKTHAFGAILRCSAWLSPALCAACVCC